MPRQQDRITRQRILYQQAHHANIPRPSQIRHAIEPIAEVCCRSQVNRYGIRHQQAGKSTDVHLERVVRSIDAPGNNCPVESPVPQHNALRGDCLGIRGPAGWSFTGDLGRRGVRGE